MSETRAPSMREHPDIMAMDARYEAAAETAAAQLFEGLTLLAGLFVAASAWIVGFAGSTTLMVNNLIVGLAVVLLGMSFALTYERAHRLTWVCPVLGAWTIASPWVVSGAPTSTRVVLTNVISGAAVVLIGLADYVPMYLARRLRTVIDVAGGR